MRVGKQGPKFTDSPEELFGVEHRRRCRGAAVPQAPKNEIDGIALSLCRNFVKCVNDQGGGVIDQLSWIGRVDQLTSGSNSIRAPSSSACCELPLWSQGSRPPLANGSDNQCIVISVTSKIGLVRSISILRATVRA